MNLSPLWCVHLEAAEHEATHWSALGANNVADHEIVERAAQMDAVLLTHDLDFGAILVRSGAGKPSVVQLRGQDLDPARVGGDVLTAIQVSESALADGALVTIDLRRRTVRVLELS